MDHEPHEPHEHLRLRDEVFRIQGAIFEVNRFLGTGFLEAAYQESLGLEFKIRGIPFSAQPTLKLDYKGTALRAVYVPDFICFGTVLIELKAVSALAPEHRSQVINYLRASGLQVGLLVNFGGAGRAQIERIVH
jgi:GxxExxY protein